MSKLSVAYSIAQKNKKKKNKDVEAYESTKNILETGKMPEGTHSVDPDRAPSMEEIEHARGILSKAKKYAKGGEVEDDEDYGEQGHASIAEAILSKHAWKKMAEGGEVDLEEDNEEGPATDMSYNVAAKDYDADEGLEDYEGQPRDSNLKGDLKENYSENKLDRISAIRKKLKGF